jgi:hypothetical protein
MRLRKSKKPKIGPDDILKIPPERETEGVTQFFNDLLEARRAQRKPHDMIDFLCALRVPVVNASDPDRGSTSGVFVC